MPDSFKIIDGRKFMWDGETYEEMDAAKTAEEKYRNDNFETRIVAEEGRPLVYTRREVKETDIEGEVPQV